MKRYRLSHHYIDDLDELAGTIFEENYEEKSFEDEYSSTYVEEHNSREIIESLEYLFRKILIKYKQKHNLSTNEEDKYFELSEKYEGKQIEFTRNLRILNEEEKKLLQDLAEVEKLINN
jgi:hypothetical protein